MQFSYQELIDRARVWCDDDHDDQKGWVKDDKWLAIAYHEYRAFYRHLLRSGVVAPEYQSESLVGNRHQMAQGATAIVGVAETPSSTGTGQYRPLTPYQSTFGSFAWGNAVYAGPARYWRLEYQTVLEFPISNAPGDKPVVALDTTDETRAYEIRYVPGVPRPTLLSDTLIVPVDADELLVCNIARAAHVKDSTVSQALERRQAEAQAKVNFALFGLVNGDGPRVRRVRPTARNHNWFSLDPSRFRWI